MQYNVIDIIDDKISDDLMKEIINKKFYKIVEYMEFGDDISNSLY